MFGENMQIKNNLFIFTFYHKYDVLLRVKHFTENIKENILLEIKKHQ